MSIDSTPAPVKDILLVGYGAVGAIYALILERSGHARVTVVARSNYQTALRNGIHFRSQKFGDIPGWRPHRLVSSVAEAADRPYAYVLVATKALPEIITTSKLLAPLLSSDYKHPQPTYVLLQNGLGVEKDLYEAVKTNLAQSKVASGSMRELPQARVITTAVIVYTNVVPKDNVDVVEHIDFGTIQLGMYAPGRPFKEAMPVDERELLDDFAGMIEVGGGNPTVVPEMQCIKFRKNFWNVAFSSVATLTGLPLTALFLNKEAVQNSLPVVREVLKEMLALGRALGFDEKALPASTVDDAVESLRASHTRPESQHRLSMLLDRDCGRPLEIDVIIGEVVRKAREVGVNIPRIEMMYALLVIIQGQLLKPLVPRVPGNKIRAS